MAKQYGLRKNLKPSNDFQGYIVTIRGKIPAVSPAAAKQQIFELMEVLAAKLPGAEYLQVSQPRVSK